jgi:hypothetical protein
VQDGVLASTGWEPQWRTANRPVFANPKVTAAKIVAGWSDRTGAAVAGQHVLAIQDTTAVKVPTTAERRRGLGPVKKATHMGSSRMSRSRWTLTAMPAWGWSAAMFEPAMVC